MTTTGTIAAKLRALLEIASYVLVIVIMSSCSEPNNKNQIPIVELTIREAGSNYIVLTILLSNGPDSWNYNLFRGSEVLVSNHQSSSDTLQYRDSELEQSTNYSYLVEVYSQGEELTTSEWLTITTKSALEIMVPQVSIHWPSLGETAAPMQHLDPQSSGRSRYSGPENGELIGVIEAPTTDSGIALGFDAEIYLTSNSYPFLAKRISPDGIEAWSFELDSESTPLIGDDSTVYLGGRNRFAAISPIGDTLWTRSVNSNFTLGVNIDKSGTLYFVDGYHNLVALNQDGDLLWKLKDERFLISQDAAPTFSPEGEILYLQGYSTVSLLAVDISNQSIIWTFGEESLLTSPIVDNAGNIYILPGRYQNTQSARKFYSLSPDGTINWRFDYQSSNFTDNVEPTIDYNGNVYFGYDQLYSLSNDGSLRWALPLSGQIISPIISDTSNNIFIGVARTDGTDIIQSVSSGGEINWIVETQYSYRLGVSPVINPSGYLLFPLWGAYPGGIMVVG